MFLFSHQLLILTSLSGMCRCEVVFPQGSRLPTFALWIYPRADHPTMYRVASAIPQRLVSQVCLGELASVGIIITSITTGSSVKQEKWYRIKGGDNSGRSIEALVFSKTILAELSEVPSPVGFKVCTGCVCI